MKMYVVMRGQFGSSDSAEAVFVFDEHKWPDALSLCQAYENNFGGDQVRLTERQNDRCFYDKDTEVYYEWFLVPVLT